MAITSCGPTLTSVVLRDILCELRLYGHADPAYGIPEQNCPVVLDTVTGLIRPFSSIIDPAEAIANFIGISDTYVEPGKMDPVAVITHGVVEVQLGTPAEIRLGTLLEPITETDGVVTWVSNHLVQVASPDSNGIFRSVKECWCYMAPDTNCPPTADAPAAVGSSATQAPTFGAVRTVLAEFNTMFHQPEVVV